MSRKVGPCLCLNVCGEGRVRKENRSTNSLLLVYFTKVVLVSPFSLNCTIPSLASVKNNQNSLLFCLKANTLFLTCSSFIGR